MQNSARSYVIENAPQGHLVVEALLVVVISALLFQRSYKPVSRKGDDLTDKVRHASDPVS